MKSWYGASLDKTDLWRNLYRCLFGSPRLSFGYYAESSGKIDECIPSASLELIVILVFSLMSHPSLNTNFPILFGIAIVLAIWPILMCSFALGIDGLVGMELSSTPTINSDSLTPW